MRNWSLRQKLRESIIEAVNRGDQLQVKALLDKGADVNESEGGYLSNRTLLIIALEKGNVDLASLLVDRGADLSATVMVNKRELIALDLAKEKELESLVRVIEKKTEDNQRLLLAVQEGDSSTVQEAIGSGANINLMHKDGDSPQMNLLFLALGEGHVDAASSLIHGGIDLHVTVAYPDQAKEDTARSYAQRLNQEAIVNLIDQEMARQDTTPDTNSSNGNSQVQRKPAKVSGSKSSGELEDIEDADLEEHNETTVRPHNPKRAASGSTCIIV